MTGIVLKNSTNHRTLKAELQNMPLRNHKLVKEVATQMLERIPQISWQIQNLHKLHAYADSIL